MVLVQFRISVLAFIELILTSPCFSKRLHHCMILWPLDHSSVLALVVHIAFGTKDKDILGNEKMSISLISRKKKKRRIMGESPECNLVSFILKHVFVLKPLFIVLCIHITCVHTLTHCSVHLFLWALTELNHYVRLWDKMIWKQRYFPCSSDCP